MKKRKKAENLLKNSYFKKLFLNFQRFWINRYIGFYCNNMLKSREYVKKEIKYMREVYFQWKQFVYKDYSDKKILSNMVNNIRLYIGGRGVYFLWK